MSPHQPATFGGGCFVSSVSNPFISKHLPHGSSVFSDLQLAALNLMPSYVISCHVMPRHAMSCHVGLPSLLVVAVVSPSLQLMPLEVLVRTRGPQFHSHATATFSKVAGLIVDCFLRHGRRTLPDVSRAEHGTAWVMMACCLGACRTKLIQDRRF